MDQNTAATPHRLRRTLAASALLLTLGAAAACGQAGSDASGAQSGSPAASSPAGSPSDPAASPSSPMPKPSMPKTSPEPTPTTPPAPGIAVGEPDPSGKLPASSYWVNGQRLTVVFYGGICEKYGLKLDESKPGTVLAKVVVTEPVQPGTSCAAVAKQQEVAADLKAPLDGRTVFDQGTMQKLTPVPGPDPVGGPKY
ncbi:hypothetical protein [Kitasatospora sp. NPDC002040]|uniref:hypothetical protein n=1 Tax=Kitasatospora sp. NPDC002040 TaxID=3154661 RepID=UPI003316E3EA